MTAGAYLIFAACFLRVGPLELVELLRQHNGLVWAQVQLAERESVPTRWNIGPGETAKCGMEILEFDKK